MYRRIRDLREDKDLNQIQIAKILTYSEITYKSFEFYKKIQVFRLRFSGGDSRTRICDPLHVKQVL